MKKTSRLMQAAAVLLSILLAAGNLKVSASAASTPMETDLQEETVCTEAASAEADAGGTGGSAASDRGTAGDPADQAEIPAEPGLKENDAAAENEDAAGKNEENGEGSAENSESDTGYTDSTGSAGEEAPESDVPDSDLENTPADEPADDPAYDPDGDGDTSGDSLDEGQLPAEDPSADREKSEQVQEETYENAGSADTATSAGPVQSAEKEEITADSTEEVLEPEVPMLVMVEGPGWREYDGAETGTGTSVETTEVSANNAAWLAAYLQNNEKNIQSGRRTGLFSWDTENKKRSWTYYNGIMMDAFMMLDADAYGSYVNDFYAANVAADGTVDNTGASDNYYRTRELDSVPPVRVLFDLLRRGGLTQAQDTKYRRMIEYVYGLLLPETYPTISEAGGNYYHKPDSASWQTYQVALDGLYMAQPFFMEIANAIDDGILDPSGFDSPDKIYRDVCTRMSWIGHNLYDPDKHLYNHGWGMNGVGVNGQFWLRYFVKIGCLSAHKLSGTHVIAAQTDSGTETIRVSALSYVKGMLDIFTEDTAAQNAAAAIYMYSLAADKYVAGQ